MAKTDVGIEKIIDYLVTCSISRNYDKSYQKVNRIRRRKHHKGPMWTFCNDPESKSHWLFRNKLIGLMLYMDKHDLACYLQTVNFPPRVDEAVRDRRIHKFLEWESKRFRDAAKRLKKEAELLGDKAMLAKAENMTIKSVWVRALQLDQYFKSLGKDGENYHILSVCPEGSLPNQHKPRGNSECHLIEDGTVIRANSEKRKSKRSYADYFTKVENKRFRDKPVPLSIVCEKVYSIIGSLFYMNKNFLTAAKHLNKRRRFGGGALSYLAYPKWAREAVDNALKDNPAWNRCQKKGSKVKLRQVDENGRVLKRKIIRSPYTCDSLFIKWKKKVPAGQPAPRPKVKVLIDGKWVERTRTYNAD